jgi:predicted transcriptional regulator
VKRRQVDERLIAEAKEMRERGMKQAEIAVELGVAQGTISRMLRHILGERWPRRLA